MSPENTPFRIFDVLAIEEAAYHNLPLAQREALSSLDTLLNQMETALGRSLTGEDIESLLDTIPEDARSALSFLSSATDNNSTSGLF